MPTEIRLATENDAAAIRAIYAPAIIESPISFELDVPSVAVIQQRIAEVLKAYPWLVYQDDDGSVAGYAYASKHAERAAYVWSVDTSVYVAATSQRRGVGRALYTSLLNLLRLQGYYNAYGGITLPNEASVGLHRALGYELVGVYENVGFKLGAWHAVAYYGAQLRTLDPAPELPRTPTELIGTPEWQEALASGLV